MEENIPSSEASNNTTPTNKTTTNATNSSSANNSSTNMKDSTATDGFRCEITNNVDSSFNSVTNELSSLITVAIHPTTGGHFDLQVNGMDNVEHLKKMISKRLKVAKERICLLYKEKDLRDGSLLENCVQDGSKIILLPMVETGLLTQKPEQSVMQALESLSDVQVNDFLSGKAPLNLTMRLGDHMMFIQLQLSTVGTTVDRTKTPTQGGNHHHHHHHHHQHNPHLPHNQSLSSTSASLAAPGSTMPSPTAVNVTSDSPTPAGDPSVVPVIPSTVVNAVAPSTSSSVLAPVDVSGAGRIPYASIPPGTDTEDSASGGSSRMPVEIQAATMREGLNGSPSDEGDFSGRAPTRPGSRNSFTPQGLSNATTSPAGGACPSHHRQGRMTHVAHLLDTRTLAEASRNLSQTLRHLSYQAHNSSKAVDNEECLTNCSNRRPGAIIESMHHHGHGVYSGTFSGTLNPALQDRHGHPKRDISTIVHILNDLLGATPQYRRQSSRCLEPSNVVQLYTPVATMATPSGSSSRFSEGTPINKSQEEYSRLSLENKATRGKMEQLQLMLEERRARRRARRDIRAPYPASWPVTACGSSTHHGVITSNSACSHLLHPMDASSTTTMMITEQMLDAESDAIFAETLTLPRDAATTGLVTSDNMTEDDDDDDASIGQLVDDSRMKTTEDGSAAGQGVVAPATATPNEASQGTNNDADPGTPMECEGATPEGGNPTNEYLKLNPETVVA